jgi:hypothetical protein
VKSKTNIDLSLLNLLRSSLVDTDDHGVVTLERLKRQLLLGLDAHLSQLCDFLSEDGFWCGGRVNAVGLDGDDDTSANLQEETSWAMLVEGHEG